MPPQEKEKLNQPQAWCTGLGLKIEDPGATFTVPAGDWSSLVLKAGSTKSVPQAPGPYQLIENPVVGQAYSHHSGKIISFAILCEAPPIVTPQCLIMDGQFGSYVTAPSAPAMDTFVNGFELQARIQLDDYFSTVQSVMNKRGGGEFDAWHFDVRNNGSMLLLWRDTLIGNRFAFSDVAPFVNGQPMWIRVTLEFNVLGQIEAIFYTGGSGDNPTWVQLGAPFTGTTGNDGPTNIIPNSDPFTLGARSVGNFPQLGGLERLTGRMYQALVFNEIGGTLAAHFNANDFMLGDGAGATAVGAAGNTYTLSIDNPTNVISL